MQLQSFSGKASGASGAAGAQPETLATLQLLRYFLLQIFILRVQSYALRTDFMLYVQGYAWRTVMPFESGNILLCAADYAALQIAVFAAYCAVIQSVNCNDENELGWYRGYFRPYF